MPDSVLLVIREPEYDNRFISFGEIEVFDIDTGRTDLSDPESASEWLTTHLAAALDLRSRGKVESARCYRAEVFALMRLHGWATWPGGSDCYACGNDVPDGQDICHLCHAGDQGFALLCHACDPTLARPT